MSVIFGYCRISTTKQQTSRQVANIRSRYPDAVILEEEYTGTKMDRPVWNKLYKEVVKRVTTEDVTIIFDEVSRMSRNADEGYQIYKKLFEMGVNLVFLKEPHISTDVYREALKQNIPMTGTNVDVILQGVNEYLMILAEKQIRIAFETAQHEVDFLHKRTSEGIRRAQLNGKQVGIAPGSKIHIKKSEPIKAIIRKYSKDFDGTLPDNEVMSILRGKTITITKDGREIKKSAGLARNTYYKYKSEMKAAM